MGEGLLEGLGDEGQLLLNGSLQVSRGAVEYADLVCGNQVCLGGYGGEEIGGLWDRIGVVDQKNEWGWWREDGMSEDGEIG